MTEVEHQERRQEADEFERAVIQPLKRARDHLHWQAVIRQRRTAKWMETLLNAALLMAYDFQGNLARGEE